ncbi:MAG: (Fe-S)-binding protein [Actinobacteria bacterium]|nr:(Fe-S)-binding protein [Actinomycetota bacterium]
MTRLGFDPDELAACVGCGLCLPHCPTYRVTGLESASPRGRITAMRVVEEGMPLDDAFSTVIDECILCRGCEAACPSGVQYGHLAEAARERVARRRPPMRRLVEWVAFVAVLPRHSVLLACTWLLLVAQRLHLVPARLGLPRLSPRSLRTPIVPDGDPTAYLFTGCVMDAWQRDVHRAAVHVMRSCGAQVGLPTAGGDCCGALHAHAGRVGEARRLARRVMASMPGDAPIVVDSAGCGAAMKDYGRLLGGPAAAAFSARVQDFAEWVAARGAPPLRDTGITVVVQDPCHLRHVQHAEGSVRTILHDAYRLVETDDDGMCCGAGGAYAVTERDLATRVRDCKVAAIRAAAGAMPFLVASANPGCAMHLDAAGLDVRHPAELLAAALDDPKGAM